MDAEILEAGGELVVGQRREQFPGDGQGISISKARAGIGKRRADKGDVEIGIMRHKRE